MAIDGGRSPAQPQFAGSTFGSVLFSFHFYFYWSDSLGLTGFLPGFYGLWPSWTGLDWLLTGFDWMLPGFFLTIFSLPMGVDRLLVFFFFATRFRSLFENWLIYWRHCRDTEIDWNALAPIFVDLAPVLPSFTGFCRVFLTVSIRCHLQ